MSYLELADRWEEGRRAERERRAAHEASFRAALRRAFALAAQGAEADHEECAHVLSLVVALTDDLGVKVADQLRCEEKARWLAEVGKCPYCGGAPHD